MSRLGWQELEHCISGIDSSDSAGIATVLIKKEGRFVLVGLRCQGIPQLVVINALELQDFKKILVGLLDLVEGFFVSPRAMLPEGSKKQVSAGVESVDAAHGSSTSGSSKTKPIAVLIKEQLCFDSCTAALAVAVCVE